MEESRRSYGGVRTLVSDACGVWSDTGTQESLPDPDRPSSSPRQSAEAAVLLWGLEDPVPSGPQGFLRCRSRAPKATPGGHHGNDGPRGSPDNRLWNGGCTEGRTGSLRRGVGWKGVERCPRSTAFQWAQGQRLAHKESRLWIPSTHLGVALVCRARLRGLPPKFSLSSSNTALTITV